MDNVIEAIALARQFEKLQFYNRAIVCCNLAIHFLTLVKRQRLNRAILELCDHKILECVRQRRRVQQKNNKVLLKKFVLLK
ncbi:ORF-38 [Agrotis segetum nucleopolyhedrovirus A]|uniref:ORF-38 n=1 Tax=Agrotis segetum nuclear polyhedrosis virus TaxID=1962501 RepID=Q287N4_NPVAS|nr:ORF-38 [Agrotis segetum nucleopolyhedrovirus A]AAZ38204.1 ORF-38 [Agrotis segetum nucleopolyhedrovirus A]